MKNQAETNRTASTYPPQFDLLKTLERNQEYTLVMYSDFGFLWSLKLNLYEIRIQPYAQYPETVLLVGRQYRKRKTAGWRIRPYQRFVIWRGYHEVRTSPWVESEKQGPVAVKKSLLSFDNEYLRMAIDSVIETPLIAKVNYGTGKDGDKDAFN